MSITLHFEEIEGMCHFFPLSDNETNFLQPRADVYDLIRCVTLLLLFGSDDSSPCFALYHSNAHVPNDTAYCCDCQ